MKGLSIRNVQLVPMLGLLFVLLILILPVVFFPVHPGLVHSPQGGSGLGLTSLLSWERPFPTLALPDLPVPTAAPIPPAHAIVRWAFFPAQEIGHLGLGAAGTLPIGDGSVPTALDDALVIAFSQPVSADWVAERLNFSPITAGRLVALDARTVAFLPAEAWRVETYYTAHVFGAEDRSHYSFATPAWMAARPGPDAIVEPGDPIHLYFHYPVDHAALLAALRVQPPADYHAAWGGQALILQPAGEWALDTVYTVTFDAVPLDWPAGEPRQWSFTTRSGVLGLQGAPSLCGPLTLNLDRPADPATLAAAWHIAPAVSGTLTISGTQLRFLPATGWQENTTYRVSLDTPLAAADGTPLVQDPHEWSFVVGAYWHPDFGYGPNVQVLDAAGPRHLQYDGGYHAGDCVDFRLYEAPLEWLLGAYSSSFKEEAPLPDLSELPLVRAWTEQVEGEIRLPEDIPPGLYVLSSGDPAQGHDGLLVALTHYTLVLKEAGLGTGTTATHQVTGYASAIATGQPRGNMHVRLYDRSARFYGEGTTDDQGRFETTVPGDTDPLLAIGEVDGELTLCGFGPEWQTDAGYQNWWGWQPAPPAGRRFRVYAYTDRPIYRPGQVVYTKAVVRADDDALYALLPTGTPVTVRLRDARDNIVSTQELATGEFGTVHAQFHLADGCTLGKYNVEFVVGEEVTRQEFKVEEYRKPDYEVIVSTDRERFLKGDTIIVTVTARYYLGQPLAGVPVSVQAYRKGYDYYWAAQEYWSAVGPRADDTTDAEGRAYFRLTGVDVYDDAATINVEAVVDDGSGQSVAGHAAVQVFRQRYSTQLTMGRTGFKPGVDIPVNLQIWDDYLDVPVSGAQVKVGLYCRGDSYYAWDSPVVELQATSGADGRVYTVLQAEAQGWYRLGVSGYGGAESWVWIYDTASTLPWESQDGTLAIGTDKSSYQVGEVAQLLVRTPASGPAMLTLERGRVRRMVPVYLTSPVTTISLTIEADFAPNIYATVQLYRPTDPETWDSYYSRPDAELLMASTAISVPVPERRLQVTIAPEYSTYAPREQAVVTLQVTDAAGNPVRAELSLAMVDEAIYALSRDLAVDPFDAFYGWRENLVRTYHALEPVRYIGGANGRGSGGGDFGRANPRKHFPDTAYWNPRIVTDEAGRAVVTIPLPDNLTRWRFVARAVTLETWVGEGTAALTVTQDLVVRPLLPRFLVQGDTFTLTTQVYNYGESPVTVLAGLDAVGLDIAAPYTYSLSLDSGGMAQVGWRVAAAVLGPATITAYAEGASASDGVQYTIPVVPFAVPNVQSWSGEYIGERIERFFLPDNYISEVTQLEVRLAPTVVPALLDGLEYLIGYPFG